MSNTERPRVWVVIANVTPTTLYTMVGLRGPTIKNAGQWNFFGGNVDEGESPEEAACRELYEETGMHADPAALSLLFKEQVQTAKGKVKPCTWFVVHSDLVEVTRRCYTAETADYDWMDESWEVKPNLHYSVKHFLSWWQLKQEQYKGDQSSEDIARLKQIGVFV